MMGFPPVGLRELGNVPSVPVPSLTDFATLPLFAARAVLLHATSYSKPQQIEASKTTL